MPFGNDNDKFTFEGQAAHEIVEAVKLIATILAICLVAIGFSWLAGWLQ